MKRKIAFQVVYYAIAAATFSHTTWSAATVFQGNSPNDPIALLWWIVQGALLAVAIDIGMLFSAEAYATTRSRAMLAAFVLAAIASGYTQVLYSLHHAARFEMGEGVSIEWAHRLQRLVDARVVLLPLALPLFAIIYTISKTEEDKAQARHVSEEAALNTLRLQEEMRAALAEEPPKAELPPDKAHLMFVSPWTGKVYGPYRDIATRDIQEKGHFTTYNKRYGPPPPSRNGSSDEPTAEQAVEDER